MTVKTNNVQKGGRKPILSILGLKNETSAEQIIRYIYNDNTYKIRDEFPCFPKLSEVTPMDGDRPERKGDDLKTDIQIGIDYARCQICKGDNCDCFNEGNFCYRKQLCKDVKMSNELKYCFIPKDAVLSFDDYYLAWYFQLYSGYYKDSFSNSIRYISRNNYPAFRDEVLWKFPMLEDKRFSVDEHFILINSDSNNPNYLSWEILYDYIKKELEKRRRGGKKSRKSRNKKRKSNKKKRKTVKKRKG